MSCGGGSSGTSRTSSASGGSTATWQRRSMGSAPSSCSPTWPSTISRGSSRSGGNLYVNERVPTPEELGRALDQLSLRGRLIALLMSQTGVPPGVLGSYRGEKGLTLGDLPELSVGGAIKFSEVPFVVRVPAGLSKTRVAYTTFGSGQLAAVMVSSLADRRDPARRCPCRPRSSRRVTPGERPKFLGKRGGPDS